MTPAHIKIKQHGHVVRVGIKPSNQTEVHSTEVLRQDLNLRQLH